jgi:iron complex transport system substrate-binding protein
VPTIARASICRPRRAAGMAAGAIEADLTRRRFLYGLGALGLLTGCGDDGAKVAATPSPTASASAGPRTWDNGGGAIVTIPADPRRIVFVDPTVGVVAVVTGQGLDRIVGMAEADQNLEAGLVDYPASWARVGKESTINIEQVALLSPDLIVSYDGNDANARLAELAPVAYLPSEAYDWKEASRQAGRLLGIPDAVEAKIGEYESRLAALRPRIPTGITVSVLRVNLNGVGGYPGTHSTKLLADLGIRTPDLLAYDADTCCVEISTENVEAVDADVVLVAVDRTDAAEKNFAALESHPLWRALRGRVHRVSSGAWISWTLAGALQQLADLESFVVPAASAAPTPSASATP